MIELFYRGMPVVRTNGLSGGRPVYGHVITKFSRMGRLLHFVTHGAPPTRFARESSANWYYLKVNEKKVYESKCKKNNSHLLKKENIARSDIAKVTGHRRRPRGS